MKTDQALEKNESSNDLTESGGIKEKRADEAESKNVDLSPTLQSNNMDINDYKEKQNPSKSIENIVGSGEARIENIESNEASNETIVRQNEASQVGESNQQKTLKETDDWEVVEVSSNASESSESSDCDVIIPLKQLDNDSYKVQGRSNQNKNMPTSSEMNHNEDSILIVSDVENISPQSTNSNPSPIKTQKTNTKTATKPKNVTKKRKFKLFTGDSSDDEVVSEQKGLKGHFEKEIFAEENLTKDLQPEVEENNHINKNNDTFTMSKSNGTNTKFNETFSKSKPKSHSDTELTDDNFPLKQQLLRENNKPYALPQLPEESDNENEIVPHSPQCNNSQIVQSKNKTLTLDKSSRQGSCQCSCSSVPLVGSPNAKRVKRQRLMNQMLQERERKLKRKMVKKMKDVFVQVLESLVESSDESDILSESDDQTIHLCKMMKRKRSNLDHPYSSTHQHHTEHVHSGNKPDSLTELKRELHYWKHKAKSNTEEIEKVLTPEELQMKKMKDELDYWKKLATSQSLEGKDFLAKEALMSSSSANKEAPMSSSAMSRTSTPVKQHREESRSTARHQNGMTKVPVSSSCYLNLHQTEHVPSLSQTELRSSIDCLNEDEPSQTIQNDSKTKLFNHSEKAPEEVKKANPFQRHTLKNTTISRANNTVSIMSRTKFTEKEKQSMIEYLVKNYDTLELIKGNMFWMQMAHDLDTQRSWQSLKNNFFQCIMKNLEQYEMPAKVRNKIILLAKQYM